jgi:hypothetical protein
MSEPRRLTREELEAAVAALRNPVYERCAHVVHPLVTGWTNCANCFAPVFIEETDHG